MHTHFPLIFNGKVINALSPLQVFFVLILFKLEKILQHVHISLQIIWLSKCVVFTTNHHLAVLPRNLTTLFAHTWFIGTIFTAPQTLRFSINEAVSLNT